MRVRLNAVLDSAGEFDYGRSQWGLKPGGLVVVEGFYGGGARDRPAARQANDLTAPADWAGGKPAAIVRLVARKE